MIEKTDWYERGIKSFRIFFNTQIEIINDLEFKVKAKNREEALDMAIEALVEYYGCDKNLIETYKLVAVVKEIVPLYKSLLDLR